MADDGLDGGTASELALDDAEHPAPLAGDEHAALLCSPVPAITLVEIASLDGAAGELFGRRDDGGERVPVIRIARQRLGVQHELSARRAGVGGDDRGLAFSDALDLGSVEGIELPAALALLLRADLARPRQRRRERLLQRGLSRMMRPSRERSRRSSR